MPKRPKYKRYKHVVKPPKEQPKSQPLTPDQRLEQDLERTGAFRRLFEDENMQNM